MRQKDKAIYVAIKSATRFIHRKCGSSKVKRLGGFSISPATGGEEVCCLFYCAQCEEFYLNCHHLGLKDKDGYTYQQEITSAEAEKVKESLSGCDDLLNKDCDCSYHRGLGYIVFKG